MSTVGFSTLDVIPSVRGLRANLERQTAGDFAAAGRKGGQQYGDAVTKSAGARMSAGLKRNFSGILAGVGLGLGGVRIFGDIISEAQEAVKVTKITEQLIRSTGGAAQLTAGKVGDLAERMSDYAAVDDEVIQSGENVLLTFRKVRNEIGEGNDIFSRATKASLDLSTVVGSDLNGSMLKLGKALQDPLTGITALGRAGVQFSVDQKAQIKAFVENNDLLSAQKAILNEVEKQVGGAAGANKTALDELSVSFKNLEEAAGTAAAPALNAFANFATSDAIPAIEATGGVVGDLAQAFNGLPTPIKAATGALVALRVADSVGLTSRLASGADATKVAFAGAAQRVAFFRAAFQNARSDVFAFGRDSGVASGQVSRLSASLSGVRAAAFGAGAGLKKGLTGALGLVGGPWGAAFIAGTAVLAHFWQEHQKAKQRVEDFTATLDKETGAITANSREFAVKQLLDDGVLAAADRLGVSLNTVTDAALGQKTAIAALNAEMRGRGQLDDQAAADAIKLKSAIDQSNGVVHDAVANHRLFADALGATDASTGRTVRATDTYSTALGQAGDKVRDLLDLENKRRNALLSQFQDATALAKATREARVEAAEGAKTLDLNTEAGLANRDALAQLASQWNNSAASVKNAKGAYTDFRADFIRIATQMGATKAEAKKLADQIISLPSNKPINVTTPGMKQAIEDARRLRAELLGAQRIAGRIALNQGARNRGELADRFASGGRVGGSGTGDSRLIWADPREWVMKPGAVSYYGDDFMRRLNNLQIPKFAGGGPVGDSSPRITNAGVTVEVGQVVTPDAGAFLRDMQTRARMAASDGMQR